MNARESALLDFVRNRIEAGLSPSYAEIGEAIGVSPAGALNLAKRLEQDGKIVRRPGRRRSLRLAGQVDLRTMPTDALRAELARRGLTMDGLATVERPTYDRRSVTCALDGCRHEVRRGHLFCRRHWFAIPGDVRERLMRAFGAKDQHAYQEAYTEAKLRLEGAWREGE